MECPECCGSGLDYCSSCNGVGCGDCQDGSIPCNFCSGSGEVEAE